MVADGLTKLATAEVLADLRDVMDGKGLAETKTTTQPRTAAALQSRRDWLPSHRRSQQGPGPRGRAGHHNDYSNIAYEDPRDHKLDHIKVGSFPHFTGRTVYTMTDTRPGVTAGSSSRSSTNPSGVSFCKHSTGNKQHRSGDKYHHSGEKG